MYTLARYRPKNVDLRIAACTDLDKRVSVTEVHECHTELRTSDLSRNPIAFCGFSDELGLPATCWPNFGDHVLGWSSLEELYLRSCKQLREARPTAYILSTLDIQDTPTLDPPHGVC